MYSIMSSSLLEIGACEALGISISEPISKISSAQRTSNTIMTQYVSS